MAVPSFPSFDLLARLENAAADGDIDHVREILQTAMQHLIDVQAAVAIGADRYERTEERLDRRNGSRPRTLDTKGGRLELSIPKLRQGSFYPSLLEPRRRVDRALLAVIQEAYVHGVSTRKVDDLVAALGGCSISKSEVSRICALLDEELSAFRERSLAEEGEFPYVWFDATYEKVREGGRIVSLATVIAMGVRASGEKCVLGVAVGPSETESFWLAFGRSLLARGLTGVRLVISDAHQGLRAALAACFAGASWQRCKVHFLRNAGALVSRHDAPAVMAVLKTIFLQPTGDGTRAAVQHALDVLEPTHPRVAQLLRDAEHDVLAYLSFPPEHWSAISSSNAIERVNAEVDRRAKVVGIFPNAASLLRLTTAVLQEQHDEWQDGKRAFSQASMQRLLHGDATGTTNLLTEGLAA
jgi:transposase-like protein